MPSRPDLRDISSNVKEAFSDADRETLLEVLTFVIKEYVVEGPPPMLLHQAETLSDLRGASFATLISALQTRFDFPELAMFVVDGENVGVRVGGTVQPLVAGRQPLTEAPRPPQPAAPPPQPGVRVVETTLQPRPPAAQPSSAPPPARGLSVRGRPSGDEAGAAPAPQPAPPAAGAPAPAAPAQGDKSDKPDAGGDDASARFSLLELD